MSGRERRVNAGDLRHARKRARGSAGYTLIEVMMGVALSAIGIMGITFMQTASVRSNQDAYESTIATNLARTWLERVKRDAMLWNTVGNPVTGTIFVGRANPASDYFVPSGLWTAPRPLPRAATLPQESSGANYHGIEVGSPDPLGIGLPLPFVQTRDIYYCTHLRFNTVEVDAAGATVAMGVDARVYWARKGSLEATQYNGILAARQSGAGCDDPAAVYTDAQMLTNINCQLDGANNYCMRVHYLRTVVRWVP